MELQNKDNDYLPMNNNDFKNDGFEEFTKNSSFCSKGKIIALIFIILIIALIICLIIFISRNKKNNQNKEDGKEENVNIYSFHLIYNSEFDNQTVELVNPLFIDKIDKMEINNTKIDPVSEYVFEINGVMMYFFILKKRILHQ